MVSLLLSGVMGYWRRFKFFVFFLGLLSCFIVLSGLEFCYDVT